MSLAFYLFLPERNQQTSELAEMTLSWVYQTENNNFKLSQGLLEDAVKAAEQYYITIVLPGEDVLNVAAEVPGTNLQRVQQAIPYVLEDSVIDDVDDLYFAINKKESTNSNSEYNVSVINKEYFEALNVQLEKAGLHADAMTADYLLLNENNTMLFDGSRVIYNSVGQKFSTAVTSRITLDNDNAENEEIQIINCDKSFGSNKELDRLLSHFSREEKRCEEHPLLCLINNSSANNIINLLQGAHKKKKDWTSTTKAWMPVSVLFAVWFVVQGGLFIVDFFSLSKQNETLNSEITKIYKQTFPQSRRIVDAKAQMKQKLLSLQKRKGQSGRSFTEMLSASAKVFSQSNGLIIKSLRYYDGRINLEVQIANLQELDKLKEQLVKDNGYQVEIQNASSGKETVTARLQIGAGS